MDKLLGIIFVLLAGTGFGFLGVFGRLAYGTGLQVSELLFWRFAIAALLLWSFCLLFKPKITQLPRRQILISLALGVLGYAVFSTLYFESIKHLQVSMAALILFTFPLFVSLIEHFFLKDKLSISQWFSLSLSLGGLALLLSEGGWNIESSRGIVFGFLAAITYSLYVVISGKVQKSVYPLSSSLYVITGAALAIGISNQINPKGFINLTSSQWLIIFGIAIVSTIGPLTLFLAGLQRLKSSTASILVTIEPIVAAFAAAIILHESLSLRQGFAAAIVLLGTIISGLSRNPSTETIGNKRLNSQN